MNRSKKVSDQDLDQTLTALVKREREVLGEILLHIQEVDLRKLYLKLAYGNLFEYLTRHLGYSAGSAQRRIDAARLGREVPTVISDLESGELNLVQVGLLQKSVRQAEQSVSTQLKAEILEKMKHKTFMESQSLVARMLEFEIQSAPRIAQQADRSVRMEITLTPEQLQKLEKMRALLSHSLPNGSWEQVFEHVADKVIASRLRTREIKEEPKVSGKKVSYSVLRKKMIAQTPGCQYRHLETGKICGSKWQLQIDHIKPRWAGGKDQLGNLQVLCANHNRYRYQQQSGIRDR